MTPAEALALAVEALQAVSIEYTMKRICLRLEVHGLVANALSALRSVQAECERMRSDAEVEVLLEQCLALDAPTHDPRWGGLEIVRSVDPISYHITASRAFVEDASGGSILEALANLRAALAGPDEWRRTARQPEGHKSC